MTVNYLLSDEQAKRLEELTEKCSAAGMRITPEAMFCMIMQGGCGPEIDHKLSMSEHTMPLRIKGMVRKNKVTETASMQ